MITEDLDLDQMTLYELEVTLFWIERMSLRERGGRVRVRGAPDLCAA